MSSIFRIPDNENLVTYYMLPLARVNKKSFGRHFENSFIDKKGERIFVELKSNMKAPLYKDTPYYKTELVINNVKFVQFNIPNRFLDDAQFFMLGCYSKMSREAKKLIYTTSTLPYNSTMGSFSMSHPVLQALDKTKTLRSFLSTTLGFEMEDDMELMESPEENWYIEHRFKTLK